MPQSVGRKLTTSRERFVRIAEVEGSIPFESTNLRKITAEMLGGRKTVICEFLGTGMISVMPVSLL